MMKSINNYISEKLVINKNTGKIGYTYFPKTKQELVVLIIKRIKNEGEKCNLNDINVSKITDMSNLFYNSKFNGDISEWDVSNVTTMHAMFYHSNFNGDNGDISEWDVSKVKDMSLMFARSNFNKDISDWYEYTNNVNMENMFYDTSLEGKEWDWFEYNR